MYVCMRVCTKSFLKTTTNSLCACAHLGNKADSDSDSDSMGISSPCALCLKHMYEYTSAIGYVNHIKGRLGDLFQKHFFVMLVESLFTSR